MMSNDRKEIDDYLQMLEDQVKRDGPENVLRDIKSQNIKGPTSEQFFGEITKN